MSGSDPTLGVAAIVRLAYEGGDLAGLDRDLMAKVAANPADATALMDLSALLFVTGRPDDARHIQSMALRLRRLYHRPHGTASKLRVLAFMAPGDFMANTPLDFLLEGSDVDLWLYFVDAETTALGDAPDHDIAVLAIGESEPNRPILQRMDGLLQAWPKPVFNHNAQGIIALDRDGVSETLRGETAVLSPVTVRTTHDLLRAVAKGEADLDTVLPDAAFPLIVRTVGSHAGKSMEKLDDAAALHAYLDQVADPVLFVCPFIAYAGPDGLYRKQRIVFIDGVAYPAHFAASEHWMVHYLSARMTEEPERRAEEAAWMADFDTDFAVRHAEAFRVMYQRFGLDYFGIDCAETADGRLLLFEADVAMLVHNLDPAEVFPYKKPAMARLFAAFVAALETHAVEGI